MSAAPKQSMVHQWEEAGASLANVLSNYLQLSTLMENNCFRILDSESFCNLAGRIDSSLQTLHVTLNQQLNQARVALTKTRNRLTSSIYRFPEEILFEIFMETIFTPKYSYFDYRSGMTNRVRTLYHNIYNIFGVCTTWRDVCLARPIFWLIVPMADSLDSSWRSLSAELSFQRSGLQDLNLVVDSENMASFDRMVELKDVTEHLSRTRTLNVHSKSPPEIRRILDLVLRHAIPERMTQLSLRLLSHDEEIHQGTSERHVFNHKNSPLRPYLTQALKSLSSLRISNICFDWRYVAFSSRLVELRMDMIGFPGNSTIMAFITSLSSAQELRDLKIIGVEAFADQGHVLPQGLGISLPKLQSLLLEDLYFNFVNFILTSITPASYRLTFNPSPKTILNLLADSSTSNVDTRDIYRLLGRFPTYKLVLSHSEVPPWNTQKGLRDLLKSMPNLKVLVVNYQDIDDELLKGIQPPAGVRNNKFPKLEVIEFRSCYTPDKAPGLRAMFDLSRPAVIRLRQEDNLIKWLKNAVQSFQFNAHDHDAPESTSVLWELWEL